FPPRRGCGGLRRRALVPKSSTELSCLPGERLQALDDQALAEGAGQKAGHDVAVQPLQLRKLRSKSRDHQAGARALQAIVQQSREDGSAPGPAEDDQVRLVLVDILLRVGNAGLEDDDLATLELPDQS